jgi:hypothetical protein
MKIAITDTCIFIDLMDLRLTSEFFSLEVEVHTSLDVYNELYPHQQELLKAYQSTGRLDIHLVTGEEKIKIQETEYPRSLSEIDKTVIYLAEKFDAMILSSDKAIRNFAGIKAIEVHGILWIFDRLVENKLITHTIAVNKIRSLIFGNIIYRNNLELNTEIEKRIAKWNDPDK